MEVVNIKTIKGIDLNRRGGKLERIRTIIVGDTKECSDCREFKKFDEFYKKPNGKIGLTSICKKCCVKRSSDDFQKNKDKHRDRNNKLAVKTTENLKYIVISHYGPCYCCKEDRIEFLTIDHINGGGAKHKREIGVSGSVFYRWIKKNNYPDDLRTACMNCNMATRYGKICPHKVVGI